MEIQIPLNAVAQPLSALLKDSLLTLNLNQQIEVKVLNSDILKNSLALQLGDKTLQVQADQTFKPSELPAEGTFLKLQVVKLAPTFEFKILSNALTEEKSAKPSLTTGNPALSNQVQRTAPPELRLILSASNSTKTLPTLPTSLLPESVSVDSLTLSATVAKPMPATLPGLGNTLTLTSPAETAKFISTGQLLNVKIIATSTDAIRLQILNAPLSNVPPGNPEKPLNNTSSTNLTAVDATPIPVTNKAGAESTPANPVLTVALNQLKVIPTATALNTIEINPKMAQPELPLNPGQKLELEVSKVDEHFEFKILNLNRAAQQTQKVTETLRQLLPQQIAPALLLNELMQYLPKLRSNETISEALHRIAQEIIQNLPKADQLTNPQTLRQSITHSGIFLEAKLPQLLTEIPPELQNDFKLNLLKLLVVLKEQLTQARNDPINESKLPADLNVLKELQQKTEGSVAKLVLDQLSSLPKDDSPKQVWNLEIPFLNKQSADKIDIEIEQDRGNPGETSMSPSWSVTITLTPPQLGAIHCKVTYIENTVNTYFRSEHPQTLAMLETHMEQLRQQFEAIGLKTGFMSTQEGHFKKSIRQKMALNNLLNEKV